MRCRKPTLTFLIVFLILTFIQTTNAITYHLPKNTTIKNGLKAYFGNTWISTTGTDITITTYFTDNWLNYTCNAGTQQIHNGSKPSKVYFNNVEQIEGETWSYVAETITLTPSGTNVGIAWASDGDGNGYGNGGGEIRYLFESGGSLGFQLDLNKTLVLEITSGVLNSTVHSLKLSTPNGYFYFTAINDTQITITHQNIDQVFVSGDQNKENRIIASGTSITVGAANRIRISWHFLPWSVVDDYFMLGVGLVGIVMLVAGPTWFARTFVSHGLDTDTIEHLGYAMLMIIMGFGFVVVWLWPA